MIGLLELGISFEKELRYQHPKGEQIEPQNEGEEKEKQHPPTVTTAITVRMP
jgi:hypothetical protein